MYQYIGQTIVSSDEFAKKIIMLFKGAIIECRDVTSSTKKNDTILYIAYLKREYITNAKNIQDDEEKFEEVLNICDEKVSKKIKEIIPDGSIGNISTFKYDEGLDSFVVAIIFMDENNSQEKLEKIVSKLILNNM